MVLSPLFFLSPLKATTLATTSRIYLSAAHICISGLGVLLTF